ncbi:COG3904 family protein [Oceanomicrobium pacificus]|uniref:Clp protease n=1 Tax=Oceanomicrobium pacificus TaxID=2692916 RepID=A0A6B0TZA4_9RHOB|nr:hypothetical protein [Oceanomicrobium pacificus]MXU66344.1 hypothetical protein [Oceanomicrobium pacificus]
MTHALRLMAAGIALAAAAPALAADFEVGTYENGSSYIFMTGDIEEGDAQRFTSAYLKIKSKPEGRIEDVWLHSEGGLLEPALAIGYMIRGWGLDTLVDEEEVCLSACGFIWLSGASRYASERALIGFHTVWSHGMVAHDGNALVKDFLSELGYGPQVADYVITPEPDEMIYLTASDARRLGIPFGHVE